MYIGIKQYHNDSFLSDSTKTLILISTIDYVIDTKRFDGSHCYLIIKQKKHYLALFGIFKI